VVLNEAHADLSPIAAGEIRSTDDLVGECVLSCPRLSFFTFHLRLLVFASLHRVHVYARGSFLAALRCNYYTGLAPV